nr:MAG TPA: hypothetical protein [Caudoviricetes sp.]
MLFRFLFLNRKVEISGCSFLPMGNLIANSIDVKSFLTAFLEIRTYDGSSGKTATPYFIFYFHFK